MLRYLHGDALHRHPKLARAMFRDRADQFRNRLGWEVRVNDAGEEWDEYDHATTLYVIWQTPGGGHGGSMRFLPTTGPIMVNDHFPALTGGRPLCDPTVWECTRFCLAPAAGPRVAAALMLGGGELMTGFGVAQFAGVFDARMERIYRAIGATPRILGSDGEGRNRISLGLWSFTEDARLRVARRAGLSPVMARHWFHRAFGRAA